MSVTTETVSREIYPVVPIRSAVAFPGFHLTFEVSDPDIEDVCRRAELLNGNILLVPCIMLSDEDESPANLHRIGTVCRIERIIKMPAGAMKIVASGIERAEINDFIPAKKKTWKANCTAKTVICSESPEQDAVIREIRESFDGLKPLLQKISADICSQVEGFDDVSRLADFIACFILMDYDDRVLVLKEFDPLKRGILVSALLEQEKSILNTQAKIHAKVKEALDYNQKEFFLKEQLKAIKEELGYSDEEDDDEIVEYNGKLAKANLPDEVRAKLSKEVKKLAKTPYASAESAVIRGYIDTCLEIPFGKKTKDRTDVAAAKKILDADHDGLEKVKERILEFIAVKQLNPDIKNQIICLAGPPGTGKTSIAMSLAKALKRNYVRVSLGGIRDEADIRGHRKTYLGSMPGRIITGLSQAGSMNPLMLLDEVDKLTNDMHGDPSSALLEVLDSEQNKAFRDHFIEFPVDLSDVMFITTANDVSNIPRPLLDRMEVIELKTYTRHEKLAIAKHHLIPKQLKRHGMTLKQLRITDTAVTEIIDFYTVEAGVRNLEREIASICRKTAEKIVDGEAKITVKAENVRDYLGNRKVTPDKIYDDDQVGVVNGLAYTEAGGDMLRIEAASMPGTGKLELTGSLGDVMKESAKTAISYIRCHTSELGIDPDFYKNKDIHLHFPEGAVPKDGPSAGVTIVTALASELSGRPVRREIAMTGEVTLHGQVLPIGGLREKTMAAYKAGVTTVFIPDGNVKDLGDIDGKVRESLPFIPCKTVSTVISGALVQR
ncbi:MAG: endopeptidase La [Firmicutes bacterium]|nr:endopeptidase La [Candidatus Colimorpha enterica]